MPVIARGCALFLLAAVAAGTSARADTPTPALRQLNLWIVDRHIVPGYAAFVASTKDLHKHVTYFCRRPAADGVGALRKAYTATFDSWIRVQHLRFGPGELESRPYRIEMWPDRKNAVGRHLAELLGSRDAAALASARFQSGSVAVQGLPAMERLLFDASLVKRLTEPGLGQTRHCDVLDAISRNLVGISVAIHSEWVTVQQPYRAVVATAGNGNTRYFEDLEATLDLFKSLHGGLTLVADVKLRRLLEGGNKATRFKRGEAWRSQLTIRNVQRNLAALQHLYDGGDGAAFDDYLRTTADNSALANDIAGRFAASRQRAAEIGNDVEAVLATPEQLAELQDLQAQVMALRDVVAQKLSVTLGIPVGFNALDGD